VLALTTSNKVLLAVFAGVFIAFALVAAFVLPRRDPDFPGERGRNWFIAVTIALFVAMMFAVSVFAKESEEAEGHEAGETVTETAPGGETTGAPVEGDPAAGRSLFASQGCGGCHAFEAAGTNATVGPNLDESLDGDDAAHVRESIVDPSAQVEQGFQPIMPDQFGDLSDEQLDDLIAFLLGRGGAETTPTETTPTETAPTETGGEAEGGDPNAGKSVFAAQGCASCHTFAPAGSTATVGPNLDESLEGDDATSIRQSIVEPSAEVVSGFQPIMPGDYGQKLSEKQLNDLIAFLQQ
jgi:mono/diheme cytochrome c family protein